MPSIRVRPLARAVPLAVAVMTTVRRACMPALILAIPLGMAFMAAVERVGTTAFLRCVPRAVCVMPALGWVCFTASVDLPLALPQLLPLPVLVPNLQRGILPTAGRCSLVRVLRPVRSRVMPTWSWCSH
jgi:hypothetical protein